MCSSDLGGGDDAHVLDEDAEDGAHLDTRIGGAGPYAVIVLLCSGHCCAVASRTSPPYKNSLTLNKEVPMAPVYGEPQRGAATAWSMLRPGPRSALSRLLTWRPLGPADNRELAALIARSE